MRVASVLASLVLAALACGGPDDRVEVPPASPPSRTEGTPGGLLIAAFGPATDAGCPWVAFSPAAAEVRATLATLPGRCEGDYRLSPAAGGGHIAVSFTDAFYDIDVAAKRAVALPPPSGGRLEVVGYEGDTLVAWSTVDLALEQDAGAQQAWFSFEGVRIPVEWSSVESAVEVLLCVSHVREGAAWRRRDVLPTATPEGTSWPFCPRESIALVEPGNRGGHGEMGYSTLSGDQAPPTPEGELGSEWAWATPPGDHGEYAVRVTWLEGQIITSPLMVRDSSGWRAVEGFEATGSLSLAWSESWLLACRPGFAGVYAVAGAHKLWSHDGSCPVLWPLRS